MNEQIDPEILQIAQLLDRLVERRIKAQQKPEPVASEQPGLRLVEPLVNVAQAAKHLDCSERKLRQLIADKKIPFRRVDGNIKFKLSELDEWSSAA